MYELGLGGQKDSFKSKELYEKACDGGEVNACYTLGLLYDSGIGLFYDLKNGIKQDDTKVKTLYKKACDGKIELACKKYDLLNDK